MGVFDQVAGTQNPSSYGQWAFKREGGPQGVLVDTEGNISAATIVAQGTTDWVNVKAPPYNAKGDGTTDDTAAIRAAIAACPAGGIVYLPAGNYIISAPLTIGAGVNLHGDQGPWYSTNTDTTTTISIAATFSGTAAIVTNDASGSGPLSVTDLEVYGGLQTSGSVIGFLAAGTSGPQINLIRCGFQHFQGACISIGTASNRRGGVRCVDVQAFYSDGASSDAWIINTADSEFTRCMGFKGTNGAHIYNANNTVFTACRMEHNKVGGYGWFFDACSVTGGIVLDGCTTDQNDADGFHFENLVNASPLGGAGAIQMIGCCARRDGNNAGSGGGNFCGINVVNCAVPVILTGCTVTAGRGDTAGQGPARGLRVQGSLYVSVEGGVYTAVTSPIFDGGSNTTFRRGPNVLTGTNPAGTTTWVLNDPWGTDTGSTFTQSSNVANAALLSQTNSATNSGTAMIEQTTSVSTDELLGAKVTGDTNRRLLLTADGKMAWGPGSATRDTNLYRASANVLQTDNNLHVVGQALGQPQPRAANGAIAWTCDPYLMPGAAAAPTLGTLLMTAVYVDVAATLSKVFFWINNAANGPTSSQNFVAIYDSAGHLKGSHDITSLLSGTGGQTVTLDASFTTSPGMYWVAFLFNASTAGPQLLRASANNVTAANLNLTASQFRACTNGSALTSLPDPITPASNSATNAQAIWAMVS